MRISHVTKGARPVTAELALLFGHAFDQSPQYWMNLQADFDLKICGSLYWCPPGCCSYFRAVKSHHDFLISELLDIL
jgi:hypothetical protein